MAASRPPSLPLETPPPPQIDWRELQNIDSFPRFEAFFNNGLPNPLRIQLQTILGACSQTELIQYMASLSSSMGNSVWEEYLNKHPVALQRQRILLSVQPGILPFLTTIALDQDHPIRRLDEYVKVAKLLNDEFPRINSSDEYVRKWTRELDLALIQFLDCTLICAVFASKDGKPYADSRLSVRLDPTLFRIDLIANSLFMKSMTPFLRATHDEFVRTIGNMRLHGELKPLEDQIIIELVKTWMFFLARKLVILSNVVLHPTFTVGLFNISSKITELSDLHISFGYDGSKWNNTPDVGIDFDELIPIVCRNKSCHNHMQCKLIEEDLKHIYIKVGSVELGKPTFGAQQTVNFTSMRNAWAMRTRVYAGHVQAVSDPLEKPAKRRYRKKRGTQVGNKMMWEDKYLRHVVREYRKKSTEDDEMMKFHKIDTKQYGLPNGSLYKILTTPKLFMPVLYQML